MGVGIGKKKTVGEIGEKDENGKGLDNWLDLWVIILLILHMLLLILSYYYYYMARKSAEFVWVWFEKWWPDEAKKSS